MDLFMKSKCYESYETMGLRHLDIERTPYKMNNLEISDLKLEWDFLFNKYNNIDKETFIISKMIDFVILYELYKLKE